MARRRPTRERTSAAASPAGGLAGLTDSGPRMALLLAVLTVTAYLPALAARYIWDDEAYVTGNETLRTLGGIVPIWLEPWATPQYYPLVHTSFWLEYRLWGLWPAGYHAINVLLHAANALLVFLLLRRLRVPGAAAVAAVFAVHPVHVESVAWITERKNVLSALFYLLSLWQLTAPPPPGEGKDKAGARAYGLAFLFFVCALLSKTVTASLPAAYLLIVWWKEGRIARRSVVAMIPFFIVGALAGSSTAWLEKTRVGAYGREWDLSLADRILIAGRAAWFYAAKLVWPHPLIFIYPRWTIDPHRLAPWLFPAAALLTVTVLAVLRRRLGRGPLTAALFFGGTLVPALGFFDIYPMRYSFVADHFQYLASLGILTTLVAAAARWAGERPDRTEGARVAAAAVVLTLATLTFVQAGHYHDYETLWLDTLAKNPACWMAANNLGLVYEKTGRLDDAVARYEEALRIQPDFPDAHTNLGNVLLAKGRKDEALAHLRESVRLAPDSAEAWNNLGGGLNETGRTTEALECYRRAVSLTSDDARLHLNLGAALTAAGALDEATSELEKTTARGPSPALPASRAAAHFNLGNALFQKERLAEAADQYRRALTLRPDDLDSRINLGYVYVRTGRGPEARALFQEVLARDPGSRRALAGMGMLEPRSQ
jgi:tetratricopeptide (TPR) repeat protein